MFFSGNSEVVLLELIHFTFLQNSFENACTKKEFLNALIQYNLF